MKLSELVTTFALSLGVHGDALIVNPPVRPYAKVTVPLSRFTSLVASSKPSFGPNGLAWPRLAPRCCTSQPSAFEEMQEKQKAAARIGDRFSRDFAKFYAVPGMISENLEFFRLYSNLVWKMDVLIDDVPEWKTFLRPEAESIHNARRGAYSPTDVSKFGPVMDFVLEAQETYTELWDEVKALFGSSSSQVMEIVDEGIHQYIYNTNALAMLGNPEAWTAKYSLEDYIQMRRWTSGVDPLLRCFWVGLGVLPKDGQVMDTCIAAGLVNDLYDYMRDKETSKQLSVWHYFDTVDDAVEFVRSLYHEIYNRVGPNFRLFLDYTMKYQQDRRTQEGRGFNLEWYQKLNSNFNHL